MTRSFTVKNYSGLAYSEIKRSERHVPVLMTVGRYVKSLGAERITVSTQKLPRAHVLELVYVHKTHGGTITWAKYRALTPKRRVLELCPEGLRRYLKLKRVPQRLYVLVTRRVAA